jgi:hypothetical protein
MSQANPYTTMAYGTQRFVERLEQAGCLIKRRKKP